MEQILLVVQVIIAAALIGMVLIQRSDTDGFGLGSGGGSGLMSGRAKANFMTRTTAIIAALFIMNSLALSVIAAHKHGPSIVDEIEKDQAAVATTTSKEEKGKKADAAKKTAAPAVPNADESHPAGAAKTDAPVKPAQKPVKKAKPAIDAEANLDKTGDE